MSSKHIIKITAQKVMAKFIFGHRFHDLNYFEVVVFLVFFEFITNLREHYQKHVNKHQFNVVLSCFKQS